MVAIRKTLSSSVKFSLAGFPPGLCDIGPGHLYVLSARRAKDVMRMALSVEIEQKEASNPIPWLITDVSLDQLSEGFTTEEKACLFESSKFFHFEKQQNAKATRSDDMVKGESIPTDPLKFKELETLFSKFQDLANRVIVVVLHESSFEYEAFDNNSKEAKPFRLSNLEENVDIPVWIHGIDHELENFIRYLRKAHITVLMLVYGNHPSELRSLIQAVQLNFMGFAEINDKDGQYSYHINFWRTPNGNYSNYTVPLILKDQRFEVGESDHSQFQINVIDRGLVFTSSKELKDASGEADNFFLLPNNEALFQKGMSLLAATVVFSYSRDMDAVEFGKKIFQLRKERGRDLKIFVRVSSEGVRHETEAFLFACGAIVFQKQSSLQHAIQVITTTFENRFTRSIPASFEEIRKRFLGIEQKGMLAPQKFIELLESVFRDVDAEYIGKGALVELFPRIGLSVEDVMQCFHPKRRGDIGTIAGDRLWVFFSGCTPTGLETSFAHGFSFPVNQLANGYRAYFSAEDILEALHRKLNGSGNLSKNVKVLEKHEATVSESVYGEKDLERVFPMRSNSPIPSAAYLRLHQAKDESGAKETEHPGELSKKFALEAPIPDDVKTLCETKGIDLSGYYYEKNKLGAEKNGEVFPLIQDLFMDSKDGTQS